MRFVEGAYHVTLEDPARRTVGERVRLRASYFTHGAVLVYDGTGDKQRLLGEFKESPLFEVAVDAATGDRLWRVLDDVHDDARADEPDAGDEVPACD